MGPLVGADDPVGLTVGWYEGEYVGSSELGILEGDAEGPLVGVLVGAVDGPCDGLSVGAEL